MLTKRNLTKSVAATTFIVLCVASMVVAHDPIGHARSHAPLPNESPLSADASVQVLGTHSRVTAEDVHRACYEVLFSGGSWMDNKYDLAYVMAEGKATILEDNREDLARVALTSGNIPDRVKDYLELGPILGIVGSRREFVVGETYDSVMLRPEGRPHFRFVCDRTERIAGILGYHLVVRSVRYGNVEAELVLSPEFPFPLFVKEYTGENPLQITLVDERPIIVALGTE